MIKYRYLLIVAGLALTLANIGSFSAAAAEQHGTQQTQATNNALVQKLAGEFADIPAGSFKMGDVAGLGKILEKSSYRPIVEQPVRSVQMKAFRVARNEVTKGQFAAFVLDTGYQTDAERDAGNNLGCKILDPFEKKTAYRPGKNWRDMGYPETDDYPVSCVSWNDAQAYIRWLNEKTNRHFRLLTEAQWEYAARAGSEAEFPWGADLNQGCTYGNIADTTPWPEGSDGQWTRYPADCSDGYFRPSPVGHYKANAWGIYDMIGNLWEWTEDCWNDSYAAAPKDGSAWTSGDCSQRIFRGGSFDNGLSEIRVAVRFKSVPSLRDIALGFRIAEDK